VNPNKHRENLSRSRV